MAFALVHSEVRSIFVSDLHLGSRACRPRELRCLLESVRPQYLYLVGDLCDGWLLRRSWQWPDEYLQLTRALVKLADTGTEVRYLLGNHDRCLQRWVCDWGHWVGEHCTHECSDGRSLLVIHGDQFDQTQRGSRRAAGVSARIHEQMLGGSRAANQLLANFGVSERRLATALTSPIKAITHALNKFRLKAGDLALASGCEGVVCGHTHSPVLQETNHCLYANAGDWLEHCSAVVERPSGQLELWSGLGSPQQARARRLAVCPPRSRPARNVPDQPTPFP